jgi:hypothetical protein
MTNKICVFLISCQKHKKQWPKFIKNFQENFQFNDFFIVYADPNLPTEFHIFGKFIILKANDFYEGLPEKILKLFHLAASNEAFSEYTHFVKMDDTLNVMHNISFKKLEVSIKSDYEGSHINDCLNPLNRMYHYDKCSSPSFNVPYTGDYIPFCYGDFYILSRKAAESITKCKHYDIYDEIYEDVMIAKILRLDEIFPIKNDYIFFAVDKSLVYSLI